MVQKTWDQMKEEVEGSAKIADQLLDGIVKAISMSTAGEIYGEDAKEPERDVIVVLVKFNDGKDREINDVFSLPVSAASWRNSDFKLGKYKSRYGKVPEVGDKVKIGSDSKGFYRIYL